MARKPDEEIPQPVPAVAQAPAAERAAAPDSAPVDGKLTGVALVYRKAKDDAPDVLVPGYAPRGVTVEELLPKPAREILGVLATGVYHRGPAWDDLLTAHKELAAAVAAQAKAEHAAKEAAK